ncbi:MULTISPECIES: hypothetical protein [Acidithiobacillus]|jgi:hypothetical protein|uniref:Uncharacterized protein n=1 Tax=Acidithiobacillus thiooxidans TaxID=930 RepID=A0A1C2HUJ9_ACITH|nr:hypothetical protein [Acidithiobacillus thiooxidans]MBU2843382.1 hypothetical protein [Acidithiobacillus thiooxidans]OCX67424.1 hypothetical protein A6M23_20895 [Acidithiobacillus thiooxidans]
MLDTACIDHKKTRGNRAAGFLRNPENGGWPGSFAATLARTVVVLGEILRPSGELFEPAGRVLS